MAWQDTLITICIVGFSYALIPQIYSGFKKRKGTVNAQTSLITTIGMYTLAINYITLNLSFSAVMAIIAGTLWFVLFVQKIIY